MVENHPPIETFIRPAVSIPAADGRAEVGEAEIVALEEQHEVAPYLRLRIRNTFDENP